MNSKPSAMQWRIPLSDISFNEREVQAVIGVLESKWLTMGPQIEAFESEFAQAFNLPHCLAVSNGTAALHLALMACEIGAGDEVIQPALNFVSAANMTRQCSAVPVFADITSLEVPIIDPNCIESLIGPKTKAVVVMHYGGHLKNMSEIEEVCRRHRLMLIEDSCHAVGAAQADGKFAGGIGDFGTFSFFSNKNMVTGEGGMVSCRDAKHREYMRLMRSHGMSSMSWDRHKGHASSYTVTVNGFNYRPDEIRGALGRVQLSKLVTMNGSRKAVFDHYLKLFRGSQWQVPLASNPHSSHHLMVVLAPDPEQKLAALQRLREARIQTSMHYPCIADFDGFREWNCNLPITREFVHRAITLPLFPTMTFDQVQQVVNVLFGQQ